MTDKKKRSPSAQGKMSRVKGQVFERTVAAMLTSRGYAARRGIQFNGLMDHDVVCDLPFNFECKAVESLNIQAAFQQSAKDAANKGVTPLVVHKKNKMKPLVTIAFEDFIDLLQWATNSIDTSNTLDFSSYVDKDENKI